MATWATRDRAEKAEQELGEAKAEIDVLRHLLARCEKHLNAQRKQIRIDSERSSYLPIIEIDRLRRIEQLAVNVVAATQPGDLDDALAALDDEIGGLDG